jgi:tetratricopeptide (TPR) repeat protein
MTNKSRSINLSLRFLCVCIFLFLLPALVMCIYIPYAYAQREPSSSPITQEKEEIPDWLARWELAKTLSYAKRYDESVSTYKRLLKERPNLNEAKVELAKVLFWQGKNTESLAVLEEIPTQNIDENTRIIMADLYVARKEYAKAEPLYRTYLEKRPEDVKIRLKLAEMLSWVKRYNDSIIEYKAILNVIPNDIQVRRKYAFTLIWAGKHTEAAAELKKTLK